MRAGERGRRRREPLWPPALVLGVIVVGLGLGAVFTRGEWTEVPPRSIETAVEAEEAEATLPSPGDRVRVEVLNAGGIPGAAARARDLLRDAGFDVVYYGNAATFGRDTSVVLDRVGGLASAEAVGRSLSVASVSSEPDTSLLVDVTVLIGTDWPPEEPLETDSLGEVSGADGPAVPKLPWWNPRRILDGVW